MNALRDSGGYLSRDAGRILSNPASVGAIADAMRRSLSNSTTPGSRLRDSYPRLTERIWSLHPSTRPADYAPDMLSGSGGSRDLLALSLGPSSGAGGSVRSSQSLFFVRELFFGTMTIDRKRQLVEKTIIGR